MILTDKNFLRFVIIFAGVFLLAYYGALFITGLAVPGGMYSSFAEKYFNVAAWLRSSLIYSAKGLLSFAGTETYRDTDYVLRATTGKGVRIVYSCLGFGVMSFWLAFVCAANAELKKKILWIIGGLLLIWFINGTRIALVLQAAVKGWRFPLGWDHHTWFNIVAYLVVFLMIFLFEKSIRSEENIDKRKIDRHSQPSNK